MVSHITVAYQLHNIPPQFMDQHKQVSLGLHNFLKQNFSRIELGKKHSFKLKIYFPKGNLNLPCLMI
jgi:hypothetical protein